VSDQTVAQYALDLGLRIMAQDPTTGYHRPLAPPRRVCCECGETLTPGSEPPTHTYCPGCLAEYERRHGL